MTTNSTQCDERRGLPSASGFRRYELCAGSYQLEAEARCLGQLAHVSSEFSEAGDRIHAFLAGVVDEDGNEIVLSESEAQTADILQERATEQIQRIFGDSPVKRLAEKRLWMELRGQPVLSGRFDLCAYTKELALCIDFKTGFSEPDPAEQNSQLKVLAVLVAIALPTVKEVIVQVISGPYGTTEARYDLPALGMAYGDIVTTLRAIHEPDAALTPSPEACHYCPAINICQAVKSLIKPVVTLQVSELPDGERAARLLDEVMLLKEHLDEIEKYYQGRMSLDPSYAIPGYAMVPGSVRREVTDWEVARTRLTEYLELDDIKGAANYRLGDLEKALGKKLKLKGKPLKERLGQILEGLIIEKQNAASLKRVSGKPSIATLAAGTQ
jgi:hypothetical protein